MAGTRVHELAKEFGMTSKELLDRLAEMKIPAKNHASTLVDAYVDKIRKELGPELAERAEAKKQAEAEKAAKKAAEEAKKKAAEEAKAKEKEAAEREKAKAAELARREKEREERDRNAEAGVNTGYAGAVRPEPEKAEEPEAPAKKREVLRPEKPHLRIVSMPGEKETPAEPAAEAAAPEAPAAPETPAQEAKPAKKKSSAPAKEKAPEKPAASAAPKERKASRFDSLLSQIESEQTRIAKEAEDKSKSKGDDSRPSGKGKQSGGAQAGARDDERKGGKHPKKGGRRASEGDFTDPESGEDRYSRMAREAERFQRDRVLDDARAAVEAAESQGEGRRRKRKEKRAKQKAAEEEAALEAAIARGEDVVPAGAVAVPTGSTVAELADLLDVPSNDIIKRLFLLGTPLTLTQTISDDLIELIADDLGREIHITVPEDEQTLVFHDAEEDLKPRPPVVTVMGHVDHGKTSLLDAIRHTGVVESEAGGITQHIGASIVEIGGRQITFIDTPGHEAFTAMRARGANLTDVVVLVVAADDGVMPQTIEAIHHSEAAGVPIVVAVNKIDKPGADPQKVRGELTAHNIISEEYGGNNMFVDVSAKKRIGIDDLLETIILQADVLELKANPDALASGSVIEAKLDKGRGPVATMLIQRGTLHVGDAMVVGTAFGRVRAMITPKGENVTEAKPSDAVEVLGLSSVPDAGDEFRVFEDERDARNLAEERALRRRLKAQNKTRMSLDDLYARMQEGETTELNLVVKADVQGSIEALADALGKMDQSEVKINIIHSAVGGITETDVTLAAASDAIIIGFNVRPQPKAKEAAEHEKVDIRTYRVIYEALDEINAARVGLLSPEIVERDTGSAEVRNLFRVPKVGVIAGCYVTEGEVSRDDKVRIVRDGTVVHEGEIASLRRFKDDVKSVKQGYECGIGIEGFQDIHEGDVIEGFRVEEVAREA